MLLAPLALSLFVLAIPIILLYVLKLRRQEHVVPSTYLWQQVLEDVQANAPWQRLRFNVLLLLQLLALAALILALARPAYSRSRVISANLIVIVDESYGMQARDVAPSRFQAAQAQARDLASRLGAGSLMSVIGMSAQPELAVAQSADQEAINRAIDGLRVGISQPGFPEALSLAASLARAGQNTRAVVLTSRDSGISSLPVRVNFPVDIVRIGGRLRDLGITAFTASRRPAAIEAVARVSNFGSRTARSDLELLANGRVADVRPLTVRPHLTQNLFWTDIPGGIQRLQVRLTIRDDVAADKAAWAAIASETPRRVLLVSKGDYFLEAALADDPSLTVSIVPPVVYHPGMERGFDLAIFDGYLPRVFPASSALVIAPPAGNAGFLRFGAYHAAGSVAAASGVAASVATVLKYVDLTDVHVARARVLSLPAWLQPLATSNGRTVLAAGEHGTARLAVIDFDLQHSDWPLRISFPIALHNLITYLAPGLTLGRSNITAGQPVTFFPPPNTGELRITRPDGTVAHLVSPFPPFTGTQQSGLYSVTAVKRSTQRGLNRAGNSSQSFAVNFFPARPAPAPGPATLHLGRVHVGQPLIASSPVSVIWPFEAAAAGILLLEWWIAFRGTRLA